jgi:hypothetical protein
MPHQGHCFADAFLDEFIGKFAISRGFFQSLNDKGNLIERLLPLVGNMIQHLPQSRLAVLLNEHDVFFPIIPTSSPTLFSRVSFRSSSSFFCS